jgi:hypothetical protein
MHAGDHCHSREATLAKQKLLPRLAAQSVYNSSEKWCEEMIIRFVR